MEIRALGLNACARVKATLAYAFLHSQLSFLPQIYARSCCLTLSIHFDYDSACTMILNLDVSHVGRRFNGFRHASV